MSASLTDGQTSALLTLPTGAGKTTLALQAARATLERGDRVLVLVPLRALAAEVEQQWQAALPGFNVQAYRGDRRAARPYRDVDVVIMTADRCELLLRAWRRHHLWLARIRLVVADELHTIADPGRGARLDAALTRLQALLPLAHVLGLTATCGNPDAVAAWLRGVHVGGGTRPVPLKWDVQTVRRVQDKPARLTGALQAGESTLVFVHARARSAELAAHLRAQGVHAEAHHAGLTADQRAEIEARFRRGETTVLIATSALELGVNLPVHHVVLYDLTLADRGHFTPLGINAAWQRAGRAGRDRRMASARVTVIGTPSEDPHRYLTPAFEPLQSALAREDALLDFMLGSLDGGWARTPPQLQRLLASTLAAAQGQLDAQNALSHLIRQGAVDEQQGRLGVTLLGRVASQAMLPVATVKACAHLPQDPTVLDVLLTACQADPGLLPRLPDLAALLVEPVLQLTPSRLLDRGERFSDPALASAALALAACQDGDEEAAAAFGLYRPQVTALRDGLVRVVSAWQAFTPQPKLALVRTMLAAQLPLGAATLALLPGVGHVLARTLAHAGFEDVEALAQADPAAVQVPGIRAERTAQLVDRAERLVATFTEDVTREPAAKDRALPLDWHGHTDPVRLQRALTLTVTPTSQGFIVTGGAAPHHVTPVLHCDCLDHTRTRRCKHVLAVLLAQADPQVIRNADLLSA
ncbi:DEAD/DEAH box helicase [Deinococcus ficus]|uniref:DEAD/DEAH box helicase n=1 Tax=Deinococcus ficus TaxID=317577 RepID=A0A221T2V8_9DEIO|nr:DEAD/DEAH box helicase [Deinococcus ficus]ASN83201.1 hypothetical protein DFI_18550 [Deinococcus ficus]